MVGVLSFLSVLVIDFDQIAAWSPRLRGALSRSVTGPILSSIRSKKPKYREDACDLLLNLAGRDDVIDATLEWIRSSTIAGYHGTRLTDGEVRSVWERGLLPLDASARRPRLVRALSQHANWNTVAQQLDAALEKHGPDSLAGRREGQVHLTLSRAGLVNGFNHYLTYGSEFDQHVAHALLGKDGMTLLARDGKVRVIQVAVPGQEALNASHPHFTVEDMRARGGVPNIVRQFLDAWSYQVAHPNFNPRALEVDCGMVFRSAVLAAWITDTETLEDTP